MTSDLIGGWNRAAQAVKVLKDRLVHKNPNVQLLTLKVGSLPFFLLSFFLSGELQRRRRKNEQHLESPGHWDVCQELRSRISRWGCRSHFHWSLDRHGALQCKRQRKEQLVCQTELDSTRSSFWQTETNYDVKYKILELIQGWGHVFAGQHDLSYVCEVYNMLKNEGNKKKKKSSKRKKITANRLWFPPLFSFAAFRNDLSSLEIRDHWSCPWRGDGTTLLPFSLSLFFNFCWNPFSPCSLRPQIGLTVTFAWDVAFPLPWFAERWLSSWKIKQLRMWRILKSRCLSSNISITAETVARLFVIPAATKRSPCLILALRRRRECVMGAMTRKPTLWKNTAAPHLQPAMALPPPLPLLHRHSPRLPCMGAPLVAWPHLPQTMEGTVIAMTLVRTATATATAASPRPPAWVPQRVMTWTMI